MDINGKQNKGAISAAQDVKDILEAIMLRSDKLPQKGRTNYHSLMLISFLVVALFSISLGSALEFDNVKSYDPITREVTITNAYGLGDVIGKAKLSTPLNVKVGDGYQKVAEFDIWAYEDYNDAIKQFTFTDLNKKEKINREFDLKMLSYENVEVEDYYYDCSDNRTYDECDRIYNGTHIETREKWTKVTPADLKKNEMVTIGIFTNVRKGDYVDWIPTIYGVEIEEWATWTESLSTDIISYWKMDESSGTTVYDSLYLHNGTNDGADIVSGKINNGLDFELSSTDKIDFGNPDTLKLSTLTISAWINMESCAGVCNIVNKNLAYAMLVYNNGGAHLAFYDWGGGGWRETSQVVPTSEWIHVVLTLNGTSAEYFYNGASVGTYAQSVSAQTVDFRIGSGNGNEWFDGIIDEVGIWGRVLSDSEVEDLYNGGDGLPYTDEFGVVPSVVLTSPSNNSNLTSSNVEFIATVTDDQYVENVSLYIDGVLNITDTNHTNGTYTFNVIVDEGVHNWSILAYDNQSLSNQSDTWIFNYTQPPIYIDLLSPSDALVSPVPIINMSCRAYEEEGVEELNLTINGELNISVTNSTPAENLSISQNVFFSEGLYNWSCSARNPSTSATSTNRTINVTYSNPAISLGNPTAYQNLSTQNINFTFNATDSNGISNVSLYIDGTLNETNASGVNGSYSFNKIISDGNHNWTVNSISIYDKSTTAATRYFSIDTSAPEITLTAPLTAYDYLLEGETLNLNWTVSDLNLDSCWYGYQDPVLDSFDGVVWNSSDEYSGWIYVTDRTSQSWSSVVTNFVGDTPYIRVYKNALETSGDYQDLTLAFGQNQSNIESVDLNENGWHYFIMSAKDDALNTNWVDMFKITGPTRYAQIQVDINCSLNTTTFNYTQDANNITFFANDTYGNIGNLTRSWTPLIGTFAVTYDSPVYEGELNTLTATVTPSPGVSITSATMYYDDTNYLTSIDYLSGTYTIYSEISAPSVDVDTNYSFGFYLTINGTVYDPQTNNQTVLNADFGECGGVSNDTILTLLLVDEELQTSILGDIEVSGEIKSVSSDETIGTIYINFTNSSNASLCFSPPSAYDLYYMDAEIRYSSDGYSAELYHIQNADITDDLGNLTLYDLNENDSTRFKVTYQDSTFNFVEDAIVQLQRKYIQEGVYKTVEAPLTSNEGVSILHIDLNSIKYRATVIKDGVVLDEFDNLVFNCQSELTGECEHKLLGNIDSVNDQNFDNVRDFYYTNPVLTNNTIDVTFSVLSGAASTVNIVLEQKDQFGNETLCNTTIISSAGAMSCDYSESLGESYIDFTIYKDGVAIAKKSYMVHSTDYLDWLGNNYIFIFVLLLSLVGMALTSPEWIIVNGIVTMVIAGGIYLARGLDFVVGLGSIFWLVVAAIILISKMAKQEDK